MNVGKKAADALRLLNEMDPEKLVSFFTVLALFYCFSDDLYILVLELEFTFATFLLSIDIAWSSIIFSIFFAQTRLFPKLLVSFLGSVARQMVSKILYINKCNMCTVLPPYIGRHISFVASIDTCYHACF